jgi:hypothetical protein
MFQGPVSPGTAVRATGLSAIFEDLPAVLRQQRNIKALGNKLAQLEKREHSAHEALTGIRELVQSQLKRQEAVENRMKAMAERVRTDQDNNQSTAPRAGPNQSSAPRARSTRPVRSPQRPPSPPVARSLSPRPSEAALKEAAEEPLPALYKVMYPRNPPAPGAGGALWGPHPAPSGPPSVAAGVRMQGSPSRSVIRLGDESGRSLEVDGPVEIYISKAAYVEVGEGAGEARPLPRRANTAAPSIGEEVLREEEVESDVEAETAAVSLQGEGPRRLEEVPVSSVMEWGVLDAYHKEPSPLEAKAEAPDLDMFVARLCGILSQSEEASLKMEVHESPAAEPSGELTTEPLPAEVTEVWSLINCGEDQILGAGLNRLACFSRWKWRKWCRRWRK